MAVIVVFPWTFCKEGLDPQKNERKMTWIEQLLGTKHCVICFTKVVSCKCSSNIARSMVLVPLYRNCGSSRAPKAFANLKARVERLRNWTEVLGISCIWRLKTWVQSSPRRRSPGRYWSVSVDTLEILYLREKSELVYHHNGGRGGS